MKSIHLSTMKKVNEHPVLEDCLMGKIENYEHWLSVGYHHNKCHLFLPPVNHPNSIKSQYFPSKVFSGICSWCQALNVLHDPFHCRIPTDTEATSSLVITFAFSLCRDFSALKDTLKWHSSAASMRYNPSHLCYTTSRINS